MSLMFVVGIKFNWAIKLLAIMHAKKFTRQLLFIISCADDFHDQPKRMPTDGSVYLGKAGLLGFSQMEYDIA